MWRSDHVCAGCARSCHDRPVPCGRRRRVEGMFGQVLGCVPGRDGPGRHDRARRHEDRRGRGAGANRSESGCGRSPPTILAEAGAVDAAEDEHSVTGAGDELPPGWPTRTGGRRGSRRCSPTSRPSGPRAPAGGERAQVAAERVDRATRASSPRPGRGSPNASRTGPGGADHPRRRRQPASAGTGRCRWPSITTSVPPPPGWAAPRRTSAGLRQAAASSGHAKRNLTDPDSRIMPTRNGWVQGYNCQLVVSSDYLILAADLHNNPTDYLSYQPMIDQAGQAARAIRRATGRRTRIGTVLADAGYASTTTSPAPDPDRLIALGTGRATTAAKPSRPPATTPSQPPHHASNGPPTTHTGRRPPLQTPRRHRRTRQRPPQRPPRTTPLHPPRTHRGPQRIRFTAAVTNLLRLHTQLAANPT